MSKSNIALAIIAGAVIGGIVAIVLKAEKALDEEYDHDEETEEEESNIFGDIAKQFSERISSELLAAENKIKSAVKKEPGFIAPHGEFGIFL